MIINAINSNMQPLLQAPVDAEATAPDEPGGAEEMKKPKKNQAFHDFKAAMKNLSGTDPSTIEILSDRLQEAATAVGADLEKVYNYLSNAEPPNGRKLLEIGAGAIFHNPNISRHPKMMSLWENAAQWEKDKHLDEEELFAGEMSSTEPNTASVGALEEGVLNEEGSPEDETVVEEGGTPVVDERTLAEALILEEEEEDSTDITVESLQIDVPLEEASILELVEPDES